MTTLNTCPCCSNSLLHHFGNHREYWFCHHCWAEMPNLSASKEAKHQQLTQIVSLSTTFAKFNRPTLAV